MAKRPRASTRLHAALRDLPGLTIVDLWGDIDGHGDEALNAAYAEAVRRAPESILLNFSGVGYINSKGIALLISLLLRARQSSHRLLAGGLSDHYREIFDITRLSDFIDVVPDEAAGLESLSRNRVS